MDRSIKIVILLACVISLGFGLIWDKVIAGARRSLLTEAPSGPTAPVRVNARVGSSDIAAASRPAIAADPSISVAPTTPNPAAVANDPAEATPDVDSSIPEHIRQWMADGRIKDGKYKVQNGDSLDKICYHPTRFRHLKKNYDDWRRANPQFGDDRDWKTIRPDTWVTIPQ